VTAPPAPWDSAEFLPLKPEGPEYGYAAGGKLYSCSREDLFRTCEDSSARGAALVWTPETTRLVTPWEIPYLEPAMLIRSRNGLRRRAAFHALSMVIWGGLAAWQRRSAEFPLFAALAVFAGVLPLVFTLRARRRLAANATINARSAARFSRFVLWIRGRPRPSTLILAGCLALAGLWQLMSGLDRSIDVAAQFKFLVFEGEPYRLVTGGLIHAGILHFILNLSALFVLAGAAEALSSRAHVAVVFLVALATSGLATQFLNPMAVTVGSSGAILGLLGFLFVFAHRRRDAIPPSFRKSIVFMVLGVAVLGALFPRMIDNAAHAGGFLGGAVAGWLLLAKPRLLIPAPAGRPLQAAGFLSLAIVAAASAAMPIYARSRVYFEGLIQAGGEVMDAGKLDAAILMYSRAIRLKPDDPGGYWMRGVARHHKGEFARAISDYDRALQLDPSLAAVLHERSKTKLAMGDRAGALADINEALKLEPRDSASRVHRAWIRALQGDAEGARQDCEAALAIRPRNADAVSMRGRVKALGGDEAGAVADFTEAIRLDPRHQAAHVHRGNALLRKGDANGALADFEQALKIDPHDPDALLGRGLVRRKKGDVAGARADLEQALRINKPGWDQRGAAEAALRELEAK
jgi:tetratricopeptide (TPR) repeat protein/membrane associated rhomboid family serine protease